MRLLYFVTILLISACSSEQSYNAELGKFSFKNNIKKFHYSPAFAKRFNLDQARANEKWNDLLALQIVSSVENGSSDCYAKIYLGNSIQLDYPSSNGFVNMQGDRFKEVFFFTEEFDDRDNKHLSDNTFAAGNRVDIEGWKEGKMKSGAGLNIDLVIRDIVPGVNFIKTTSTLCEILNNKEYTYKLLLKKTGNDFSEFLHFELAN